MSVVASQTEDQIVTTNPAEVARMKEEKRNLQSAGNWKTDLKGFPNAQKI